MKQQAAHLLPLAAVLPQKYLRRSATARRSYSVRLAILEMPPSPPLPRAPQQHVHRSAGDGLRSTAPRRLPARPHRPIDESRRRSQLQAFASLGRPLWCRMFPSRSHGHPSTTENMMERVRSAHRRFSLCSKSVSLQPRLRELTRYLPSARKSHPLPATRPGSRTQSCPVPREDQGPLHRSEKMRHAPAHTHLPSQMPPPNQRFLFQRSPHRVSQYFRASPDCFCSAEKFALSHHVIPRRTPRQLRDFLCL